MLKIKIKISVPSVNYSDPKISAKMIENAANDLGLHVDIIMSNMYCSTVTFDSQEDLNLMLLLGKIEKLDSYGHGVNSYRFMYD